ncbi:hypothetical protein M8J76_011379 [Diaphorina citri]|nr:hypothetical protein M8J76_011379 [Diaphorina citri]
MVYGQSKNSNHFPVRPSIPTSKQPRKSQSCNATRIVKHPGHPVYLTQSAGSIEHGRPDIIADRNNPTWHEASRSAGAVGIATLPLLR